MSIPIGISRFSVTGLWTAYIVVKSCNSVLFNKRLTRHVKWTLNRTNINIHFLLRLCRHRRESVKAYLILSAVVQFPVFGLRQARNSNLIAQMVYYRAHVPVIGFPLYHGARFCYFCRGCFDSHACLFLAWVRLWLSSPGNFELRTFKQLSSRRLYLCFLRILYVSNSQSKGTNLYKVHIQGTYNVFFFFFLSDVPELLMYAGQLLHIRIEFIDLL